MTRFIPALCLIFVALLGCGGSSSDDAAIEEALTSLNLVASEQTFGQNGNLWKPSGDDHGAGGGNLVVLLSSQFTTQFDSCDVRLNTGEVAPLVCINNQPWTHTPYSCFSNGNRQTWRANFKCSSAAEVKVVCRDIQQEVIFTVDESIRNQICSRHG